MAKLKHHTYFGHVIDVVLGIRPERNPKFRSDKRPLDNGEERKKRTSKDYRHGECYSLKKGSAEFEKIEKRYKNQDSEKED